MSASDLLGPSVLQPAPAAALAAPARQMPKFSMENLRERKSEKMVLTFYGDKDGGKTRAALSLPGRLVAISFDNKTLGVKVGAYGNDRRIWVVDGLQYYTDAQPEEITWSAVVSIDFVNFTLDQLAETFHPDWIVLDGTERLEEMAEMKMRHQHGLKPSEGFAERAWWKDRRMVLRALHRKALSVALMGVAYTAYYSKQQVAEEGSLHIRDKTPQWIDVMHQETDIAIECRSSYSVLTKSKSYEAYVLAAKPHLADVLPVGKVYDITGKPIPWGPGMKTRFEAAEATVKGLPITWPEGSNLPTEQKAPLPPPAAPTPTAAPTPSSTPSPSTGDVEI